MTDTPLPRHPPRLGLAFVPSLPPERLADVARACDEHLDDLWVWEDCFKESGIAAATAALAVTSQLRVGLGLMPAPLRNVALTAMEVATVQRMFPGRFRPAVGHGVLEWMGQVGGRVASPLTLLEEYTVALRALLRGEEVTTSGRYVHLDHVQLSWPPENDWDVLVGGTGPKTLELAGRAGDGVLLAWVSDDEFAASRTAAQRGHEQAHKAGQPEYLLTILAATGEGAQQRVDAELAAWGKEPAAGLAAAGDAHTIAALVSEHHANGASTIVVQPTRDEPDLEGFIAFLGREVRPLLHTA